MREKPLPTRPVATRGPLLAEEQRAISIFEAVRASEVRVEIIRGGRKRTLTVRFQEV